MRVPGQLGADVCPFVAIYDLHRSEPCKIGEDGGRSCMGHHVGKPSLEDLLEGESEERDHDVALVPDSVKWGSIDPSSGGGGGGGSCFIATAAFGSYLDPHVAVLRSFRDSFLLTNRFGKAFVAWYYATSPPYADAIRQNGLIKAGECIALLPAIGFAYLSLAVGVTPALCVSLAFLFALASSGRLFRAHCAAAPTIP